MGFRSGFVVGLGAGYVLGARAGRERYEDIRRLWGRFSGSATVQRAAERTRHVTEEGARKGLHVVQHGVEKAGIAVRERLHRTQEDATEAIVDLVEDREGRTPEQSPGTVGEAFTNRTT